MSIRWEDGIQSELNFWDNWFKTKGSSWPEDYVGRLNPEKPFRVGLLEYLSDDLKYIKILDVGAGPITNVGYKSDRNINITAIDPLAEMYNDLYKKYDVNPPIKTTYAKVESLTSVFKENTFNLVIATNSLDHSENPIEGLKEMVKCAKPNSWIILNHARNEGINRNYSGFHQWNFYIENEIFYMIDRSGLEYNINEILSNQKIIAKNKGDRVILNICKNE